MNLTNEKSGAIFHALIHSFWFELVQRSGYEVILTTKSDVFTLVLVFTYGAFAPTQVLELPVSTIRLSEMAHIEDYIPDRKSTQDLQ
jgi:hypothetical protein